MCNNGSIRYWLLCVWVLIIHNVYAQNATLTINESVLNAGATSFIANGYNYQTGLALLPTLYIKTAAGTLTGTAGNIPVDRFTATSVKDNTDRTTVTLGETDQVLNGSLLGLLSFSSGPFSIRYAVGSLSSYAWLAGNYSTNLNLRVASIGLGSNITPSTATLSVVVSPFISYTGNPLDITLAINSFDYFRNGYSSNAFAPINGKHTVPLYAYVSTSASQFTFTNGNANVVSPQTATEVVKYQITAPLTSNILSLNTTQQVAYGNAVIPVGNATALSQRFSVSVTDLKTSFINKGTYTTTLNYRLTNSDTNPTINSTRTANLRVVVADLLELNVNNPTVNFLFNTAEKYRNGIVVDVADHLVISATIPYAVKVKASAANFTSGSNAIPVGVLSIGSREGQAGVNTISSVANHDQLLIGNGVPTIDLPLGIKYSIPASQTDKLLNKKAGTYTTNIIYTLTAL